VSQAKSRRLLAAATMLVAVLGTAHAVAAGRLDLAALSAPGATSSIGFGELVGLSPAAMTGVVVPIPSAYRRYEPVDSLDDTRVWCKPSDCSRLRRGRKHSGRWGVLVAEDSHLVAWDPRTGRFRENGTRDERTLASRFAELGAKHVRIERLDRGDTAILLVEADIKPTERLRALYVGEAKGTRMLYYLPQRPWSEADAHVWGAIRDALVAAKGSP
jgi:hypothetical protein